MTAYVGPFFDRVPVELVAQVFTSGFISRNYISMLVILNAGLRIILILSHS